MKRTIFAGLVLLAGVTGEAMALNCAGTPIATATLVNTLKNGTFCVGSTGNWQSQEFHQWTSGTGGNVIDWKKGASDPIDPTTTIGTWNVTGTTDGIVTYSYTGTPNSNYSYTVYSIGSFKYEFCNGSTLVVTATRKNGQVAC